MDDPLITVVRRLVVHSHRTGIHTVSQLMKDTHREEAHPLLLVGIEAPPNVGLGRDTLSRACREGKPAY